MKKILFVCLVLVGLAAVAVPPLLEKQVEQLTLANLKTWDSPTPATAENIRCSFWKRTLTLTNLTFTQTEMKQSVTYRIASLQMQFPLSLLWNAVSLRAGLSGPARVDVAESFSLTGLTGQTSSIPHVNMTCARGHGSRVAVDSAVLGQILRGAPVQKQIQPWKQISFDEAVAEDIKVDIFQAEKDAANKKAADMSFTAASYTLRNWNGAVLDTLRAENCRVFGEGQPQLHLKAAQYNGVKAPSDALYTRMLKLDKDSSGDEVRALYKDFFTQAKPLVDSCTVEGLEVDEPMLPMKVERIAFDWRSTAPWDSTFSVIGFSLPASIPAKAWHLRLPALEQLKSDIILTVTGLGGDTFREKLSITAPSLVDVDSEIIQTWTGDLAVGVADLPKLTLNDMKLHVVDHGLLAYIVGNLTGGRPEELQSQLQPLQALLLQLGNSAEAKELTDNLLNFIQNPGTLDVALRTKPLPMAALHLYGDNSAVLLKTSVFPGKTTLESQIRALFTTAPTAK